MYRSTLLYSGINYYDYENVICEHFEIAFLSFAFSCLMLSIGFFVNTTIAGSVPAPYSLPSVNSPVLNLDIACNNENVNKNCPREKSDDAWHILRDLRVKNTNRIVIASLNINSIPNKFDALKTIIPGNIDIFVLTETKLDDSFPTAQFCMEGFSAPYRFDRDRNGGGILIYVREDISSRLLSFHDFPCDIEGLFVEINLRKTKWLLFGTYHPPSQNDQYFFNHLGKALDIYSPKYEKFVLTGDFNSEEGESCLDTFLCDYDAKNIVKEKTCFKNIEKPSCIDLIITNSAQSFQNTNVVP